MTSIPLRLIAVELRRATDTPGPRWAIGSCVVAGLALALLQPGGTPGEFVDFVNGLTIALPVLVAILAVTSFTADWATRSALITFALTPRRQDVLGARSVAVLALTTGAVVAFHLLAAAAFVLIRPSSASTIITAEVVGQLASMLGVTIAITLTSVAVAGLVLRTALALVLAALMPFCITLGLAFVPSVVDWLAPYSFSSWLASPTWRLQQDDAIGLAPAMTSFFLWTLLPLVASWFRQLRAEPR